MTDTSTIIVTRPGQAEVLIGPFIAPSNAERYAENLRAAAQDRGVEDADIQVQVANPSWTHLDSRIPTDPWSLAELIENEEDPGGFPNLLDRLRAQLDPDRAALHWSRACSWISYCEKKKEEKDAEPSRREQLTAAAEDWRAQRTRASDALQTIATELWKDGLENVREIGRITGLSRTTIYAALRTADIEPTHRTNE